jgi:DNA-binding transcriptional LysR family regulator
MRPVSLNALQVFSAAVRTGSFTRAADVLHVTQSAVSRQIKQLEVDLGVLLFIRHKRGLRLTSEAETLFAVVDEAFSNVRNVCDTLRSSGQVLTLRVAPTLAVRWFLPLLPRLRAHIPGVDIRVSTDDGRGRRLEEDGVDAAIVYGRGDWPGVVALPIMPERLTPVCAPAMASRLDDLADLRHAPLLQCPPSSAWGKWLAAAGAGWTTIHPQQSFDTLELALSAAIRGQGVALGDLNLLDEALRDGTLVAPFDFILDQGASYYLVYPPSRASSPKIVGLQKALLEAASVSGVGPASGA